MSERSVIAGRGDDGRRGDVGHKLVKPRPVLPRAAVARNVSLRTVFGMSDKDLESRI